MKLLDLARWEPTCVHCEETWTVKKDCKRFISQKENQAKCSQPKLSSKGGKQQQAVSWHWGTQRTPKYKRLLVYVDKKKQLLDARYYWKTLCEELMREMEGENQAAAEKKTQIRLEKRGNVGCEIQLCSSSRDHEQYKTGYSPPVHSRGLSGCGSDSFTVPE